MTDTHCQPRRSATARWLALGTGMAAGFAFLIGLYLGIG